MAAFSSSRTCWTRLDAVRICFPHPRFLKIHPCNSFPHLSLPGATRNTHTSPATSCIPGKRESMLVSRQDGRAHVIKSKSWGQRPCYSGWASLGQHPPTHSTLAWHVKQDTLLPLEDNCNLPVSQQSLVWPSSLVPHKGTFNPKRGSRVLEQPRQATHHLRPFASLQVLQL